MTMTPNNYSRHRGASWFGFYFSRFLTSRVLRVNVFGRTYRLAWTWRLEAGRVRAVEGDPGFGPVNNPDLLRQAMANAERAEAGA